MLHGKPLQPADIDRIIHHCPAAPGFTGMFTDQSADCRKRVILTDQTDRICVPPFFHQRHVPGNIHTCRALRHTWNRLVQRHRTTSGLNMALKIAAEPTDRFQYHTGCLIPDGTISRIKNALCRFFNHLDRIHIRMMIQNRIQQLFQLPQPDSAWYTFSTGLGMTHLEKRTGKIHRAQSRRAGCNSSFQIFIKTFNRHLSPIFSNNT